METFLGRLWLGVAVYVGRPKRVYQRNPCPGCGVHYNVLHKELEMKRRSFLKGLLGVAAIPYIGLPTPTPVPNITLVEAARRTQKILVDGVINNLMVGNPMYPTFLPERPSSTSHTEA
jgi:hypothetical protein